MVEDADLIGTSAAPSPGVTQPAMATAPRPHRQPTMIETYVRTSWQRFLNNPRWFTQAPTHRFRLTLERGLLLLALSVFMTGILAAISAAAGVFRAYAPIAIIAWAVLLLLILVAAALKRIHVEGDKFDVMALVLAVALAVSAGVFHHHIYSAQTDIGFYVTDAALISQTGGRTVDGDYDNLLPAFARDGDSYRLSSMFGYSSLAALMVYAFGPFASPWINGPLAFVTVLALYRVARYVAQPWGALIGVLLYCTSLVTIYLSRWAMTENAATPTFWVSVLLMIRLMRSWDNPTLIALILSLAYAFLVRMEGLLVAAWFALILIIRYDRPIIQGGKRFFTDPTFHRTRKRTFIGAAIGLVLLIPVAIALIPALPFEYLRAGFRLASQFLKGRPGADATDVETTGIGPNWGDYALRYEWDSAMAYYLPYFLLVAVLGIALRIVSWRRALLLSALAVPYLIFVMIPPVTTAHPWFMRRLWVAWIPLIYILAGGALDPVRLAWRWPWKNETRLEPRWRNVIVGGIILCLLLAQNAVVAAPLVAKQEDDGLDALIDRILEVTPPGAAIIIDQDAVEFASLLRLYHDGPVVSWFNNRDQSMFASIDAADAAGSAVLIRSPYASRNPMSPDAGGHLSAQFLNESAATAPRTDFRTYINSPPLRSGYAPLEAYLEKDVPPARWIASNVSYQFIVLKDPAFLQKHVTVDRVDWLRSSNGLRAINQPSSLKIESEHFRADVKQSRQLGLHIVYLQVQDGPINVTSPNHTKPLGALPSDGSGTVRNHTVKLPMPLDVEQVYFPRGTVIRGVLVDLR